MFKRRIKSVVNVYDIIKDKDNFIEETFEEAINSAMDVLEESKCTIEKVVFSTLTADAKLIKTADILYTYVESDDVKAPAKEGPSKEDERVPVTPSVGRHPRKVTEEIFDFVHNMFEQDYTLEEITDFFEGKLSLYTVRKVKNTVKYDDYYQK